MSRTGECIRNTKETQIEVSINLDGSGKCLQTLQDTDYLISL